MPINPISSYAKASYFTEALLSADGTPLTNTDYVVRNVGGGSIITVYSDVQKTSSDTAELTTDASGNASFYADPGLYDLVIGSNFTRISVSASGLETTTEINSVVSQVNTELSTNYATKLYVDSAIEDVSTVNTDVFARRDTDNNFANNAISNVRTDPVTLSGTSYTLQASNSGSVLRFTASSAVTITLPNSLPAGVLVVCAQRGTGQITFTPASGATRNNRQNHTKSAGQYSVVTLYVDSNSSGTNAAYILAGDTAA